MVIFLLIVNQLFLHYVNPHLRGMVKLVLKWKTVHYNQDYLPNGRPVVYILSSFVNLCSLKLHNVFPLDASIEMDDDANSIVAPSEGGEQKRVLYTNGM